VYSAESGPDCDIPVPPVPAGAEVHRRQVLRGPPHFLRQRDRPRGEPGRSYDPAERDQLDRDEGGGAPSHPEPDLPAGWGTTTNSCQQTILNPGLPVKKN